MATDLYGIRVLGVDLERREVEFRVFVVYYETADRTYMPLPDAEPGFFLCLLWGTGQQDQPIGRAVSMDQALDRPWVAKHARWFVERVEQTGVRNDPPTGEAWDRLADFYYEEDGRWEDEQLLVQGDYVVRVTDSAWIEHLKPGQAWGETFYPMDADRPRPEELPRLPNVHEPVLVVPFDNEEPSALAFSDDGRFLAVRAFEPEVVVYDCADWSEHDRFTVADELITARMDWSPGRHILVHTELDEHLQSAYDADTRTQVEIPFEPGTVRSRTGRYRARVPEGSGLVLLTEGSDPVPVPGIDVVILAAAFAPDESRLYAAGRGTEIFVIDPATGAVVDTIAEAGMEMTGVTVSPDGAYLATVADSLVNRSAEKGHEVCVRRLSDGEVILRHWPGVDLHCIAWSPDGSRLVISHGYGAGADGEIRLLPIGLPSEPPADLLPAKE